MGGLAPPNMMGRIRLRAPDKIRSSYYSASDGGTEYCDERVYLSVCVCLSVRDHISGTTHPIFTKFLCRSWLGPPLAALRYVMYFRFMDDVILAHYTVR